MADRDRTNQVQVQVHPQHRFDQGVHGGKNYQSGPSTTQLVLPVIGLCVATPLFVIFSPVLVPAAITVAGFLSSCAFGLTGMSSLVYMFNRLRRVTGTGQLDVDQAKRRMQDMAGYVGQKTKEVGQKIESKAHKGGRR